MIAYDRIQHNPKGKAQRDDRGAAALRARFAQKGKR